jgi:hypothetical protein
MKIHKEEGTKKLFEWYLDMEKVVQLETLAALVPHIPSSSLPFPSLLSPAHVLFSLTLPPFSLASPLPSLLCSAGEPNSLL